MRNSDYVNASITSPELAVRLSQPEKGESGVDKMDEVRVFHVDPNQLFREGLRRILSASRFKMEGEATTLNEGLKQISNRTPQVLIIDTAGPENKLTDVMSEVDHLSSRPRVVVLTETLVLATLTHALGVGVDGYLLKDMSPMALEHSLNLVVIGEKVFPTELAHLLISNRFSPPLGASAVDVKGLSHREGEILSCLVNGESNKAIANRLKITEGTVKVHLKGILKKIKVSNRTQAAIWALQSGLVSDVFERTLQEGTIARSG